MAASERGVAIYCRISSDRLDSRDGVQRQEAACRLFAESREWSDPAVFVDNDISAFDGHIRPAYRELLAGLEAGRFHAVIAWDADRLHRSVLELEHFIDLLARVDATFLTVTGGSGDLHTATGRLQARMKGTIAHYESEHKSERQVAAAAARAHAGQFRGSKTPYGYDVHRDNLGRSLRDGRLKLVDHEVQVIRRAISRVLDDGASAYQVCVELSSDGVPSPAGLPMWRTATLRLVLTNPALAGLRRYRGEVVAQGLWPPVISLEVHETLRARLLPTRRRAPSPRGPSESTRTFPLSGGLLECGNCGNRLTSAYRSPGSTPAYRCPTGPDHRGCGRVFITGLPLEEFVIREYLARRLRDEPDHALWSDADNSGAAWDAAADQLLDGNLPAAAWHMLTDTPSDDPSPADPDRLDVLVAAFQRRSAEWQHQQLRAAFSKVIVRKAVAIGRGFDTGRIFIHWHDGTVTRGHPRITAAMREGIDLPPTNATWMQPTLTGPVPAAPTSRPPATLGARVDDELVATLYLAGATQPQIADRLRIGASTVSRSLRRTGTPVRRPTYKLSADDVDVLVELSSHATHAQMAARFGVATGTVARALKRRRDRPSAEPRPATRLEGN